MGSYSAHQRQRMRDEYAELGASGIVAFLTFMEELDTDERTEILKAMLLHRLERKTKYDCPFHFFGNYLRILQQRGLGMDKGDIVIDQVCQEAALMWERTGDTTH